MGTPERCWECRKVEKKMRGGSDLFLNFTKSQAPLDQGCQGCQGCHFLLQKLLFGGAGSCFSSTTLDTLDTLIQRSLGFREGEKIRAASALFFLNLRHCPYLTGVIRGVKVISSIHLVPRKGKWHTLSQMSRLPCVTRRRRIAE